jgi:hypothetical protein
MLAQGSQQRLQYTDMYQDFMSEMTEAGDRYAKQDIFKLI